MSPRIVLVVALVTGCGGSSAKPAKPAPTPQEPAPTAAPAPAAPADTPKPADTSSFPTEADSKRLSPPQRWEEIGKRGDEEVLMGFVEWKGGDTVDVQVMGSMKYMLQQQIDDAIKAKPDDPGAAIQGVMDMFNDMAGQTPIRWVRK